MLSVLFNIKFELIMTIFYEKKYKLNNKKKIMLIKDKPTTIGYYQHVN